MKTRRLLLMLLMVTPPALCGSVAVPSRSHTATVAALALAGLPSPLSNMPVRGQEVETQAAGDLDPSFGNGGKVTTDFSGFGDFGSAIAIQSDGKIVVA